MPKVSVLMPNYNTKEEFLRESIESILNQTFADFELIIVDDCSKEDITPVLNSYNDKRIKFHKNEQNMGVSKTRNRLLDLAQGEYIAFQDSDDISLPQRLEKQAEYLDKNPEISAVGSWIETFPNGRIIKHIESPKILDFVGGCVFPQQSAMLRINDFNKYDLKYNNLYKTSEDYDLWSRAIKYLNFYSTQEVLVRYRKNPTSLVHKKGNDAEIIDRKIKENLLSILTNDVKLRKEISKVLSKHYTKKISFLENIFSVRNEWIGLKKTKVLTIFGIIINLK